MVLWVGQGVLLRVALNGYWGSCWEYCCGAALALLGAVGKAVFIDFFDILFGAIFVTASEQLLSDLGLPVWLIVLLSQGLGGGIQLVATFIPVIGFLFLCLSVMEDSGYMARAAFVIDRLMIGIGLPGSAFVPLIVGFGCNVPAVMATRSLSRENDLSLIHI